MITYPYQRAGIKGDILYGMSRYDYSPTFEITADTINSDLVTDFNATKSSNTQFTISGDKRYDFAPLKNGTDPFSVRKRLLIPKDGNVGSSPRYANSATYNSGTGLTTVTFDTSYIGNFNKITVIQNCKTLFNVPTNANEVEVNFQVPFEYTIASYKQVSLGWAYILFPKKYPKFDEYFRYLLNINGDIKYIDPPQFINSALYFIKDNDFIYNDVEYRLIVIAGKYPDNEEDSPVLQTLLGTWIKYIK